MIYNFSVANKFFYPLQSQDKYIYANWKETVNQFHFYNIS